jgi:hypothetical protein
MEPRVARNAGSIPKATPAAIDTTAANTSVVTLMLIGM